MLEERCIFTISVQIFGLLSTFLKPIPHAVLFSILEPKHRFYIICGGALLFKPCKNYQSKKRQNMPTMWCPLDTWNMPSYCISVRTSLHGKLFSRPSANARRPPASLADLFRGARQRHISSPPKCCTCNWIEWTGLVYIYLFHFCDFDFDSWIFLSFRIYCCNLSFSRFRSLLHSL